jgi:hypothetical protein
LQLATYFADYPEDSTDATLGLEEIILNSAEDVRTLPIIPRTLPIIPRTLPSNQIEIQISSRIAFIGKVRIATT